MNILKYYTVLMLSLISFSAFAQEDFQCVKPLTPTSQTLFVIPCNFTDETAWTTIQQLIGMTQTMGSIFNTSSYGQVSFTSTVASHYYLLPHPVAYYGDWHNRQLISADALAAVQPDYGDVIHNYDHVVFFFPPIPHWGFGAFSDGQNGIWINGGSNTYLLSHEMGHQFFLNHAQRWSPCDPSNPVDPCGHIIGSGDCNDIMITAKPAGRDFNAFEKAVMGWIMPTQIKHVTVSGTYRVFRCDDPASLGFTKLALTFPQPSGAHTYWVSYRYTSEGLRNGAYITWADQYQSILIDHTPSTPCTDNAMWPIGTTLNDNGLTITPIRLGGTEPAKWIDVRVTLP